MLDCVDDLPVVIIDVCTEFVLQIHGMIMMSLWRPLILILKSMVHLYDDCWPTLKISSADPKLRYLWYNSLECKKCSKKIWDSLSQGNIGSNFSRSTRTKHFTATTTWDIIQISHLFENMNIVGAENFSFSSARLSSYGSELYSSIYNRVLRAGDSDRLIHHGFEQFPNQCIRDTSLEDNTRQWGDRTLYFEKIYISKMLTWWSVPRVCVDDKH